MLASRAKRQIKACQSERCEGDGDSDRDDVDSDDTHVMGASTSAGLASRSAIITEIDTVFAGASGQAIAVARCESGINTNVREPRFGEEGVFQFMLATWNETPYRSYSRYNAWANIHAAYWLYERDGDSWREWTCGRLLGFVA